MDRPLKVYLTGGFAGEKKIRQFTSGFEKENIAYAIRDVTDTLVNLARIREANVFILYTPSLERSDGSHVEFGYALAQGLMPIRVGPPQNLYQAVGEITQFKELDDKVLEFLKTLEPTGEGMWH